MKINRKRLKLVSSVLLIIGVGLAVANNIYNDKYPEDSVKTGFYIGIGFMLISLLVRAPWNKEKNQP